MFIHLISHPIAVTGPGKLTVGKLYGGILIYEIWKTTRFSNLEILAKVRILNKQENSSITLQMEREMATKLETEEGDFEVGSSSSGPKQVKVCKTQLKSTPILK